MSKTINLGYYFVALIDIVGQRDKLKQLVTLPRNDSEKQRTAEILFETSEYVKELRLQFDTLFKAAEKPTGLLNGLNTQQRAWVEQRKKTFMWRQGFSDSYITTVPCWYESSRGAHTLDIYRSLFSICGLYIWALAMKKPFRGSVEVGLGIEIGPKEVYGPVITRVVELEKNAGYPRIVVGEGLVNHLNDLEQRCSDNIEGKHTKHTIQDCRSLFIRDHTDTQILDPMGAGVKSVPNAVPPEMIERAYEFVLSQEEFFSKSSDKHLQDYYRDLRKYCESKLPLWGLTPSAPD